MKVTHCPNCQTCFKVTDEQLKLYNGKVRCGRCAFVFNALNHLVEVEEMAAQTLHMPPNAVRQEHAEKALETTARAATAASTSPAEPAAPAATPVESTPAPVASAAVQDVETASAKSATDTDVAVAEEVEEEPADASSAFIPRAALQEALAEGTADVAQTAEDVAPEEIEITTPVFADELSDETERAPVQAELAQEPVPGAKKNFYVEPELDLDVSPAHELEEEPPQRQSRVFKPIAELNEPEPIGLQPESRFKPLWLGGSILAGIILAGQLTYANRTQLATSFPGLKPALAASCRTFGCTIPLPADDSLISIESSELTPDPSKPHHIRLSATLRNRAEFDQELPLLELTLTDTNEQIVVKRVFEPASYLDKSHPVNSMLANSELQALVSLDTGDTKAAGYRLFLFYPK